MFIARVKPNIIGALTNKVVSNSQLYSISRIRFFCEQKVGDTLDSPKNANKLSGFAQAFEKHSNPLPDKSEEQNDTFASLLRNSKFIDMGDPEGKIVYGKIFHIVNDDLYIDFGWKFHCVCTRPIKNASEYVRGARVRLRVKDLELSTRFLGSTKDLTILEADCYILGLVYSPARQTGANSV